MKIFLLFLITSFFSYSQEVVISEYLNEQNKRDKWVELLVVEDNIDLENYILRDNSNDNGSLGGSDGGIRFNDNNVWKNLPSGLLIIITLRDNITIPEDVDPSDGLVVVSAANPRYFEQLFEGSQGSWEVGVFNISGEADLFVLTDAENNHVHQLGHAVNNFVGYDNLGSIKKANLTTGESILIHPGINLQSYSVGKVDNDDNVKSTSLKTFGKANFLSNNDTENSDYIMSLKEPKFNIENLELELVGDSVLISWDLPEINPELQPLYGCIILKSENRANLFPSKNGFYIDNQSTDDFKVVKVYNDITKTSFLDTNVNESGKDNYYRVFPFKFVADEQEPETSGMGSIYNYELVAESSISRGISSKLELRTSDGETSYCYDSAGEPKDLGITLRTNIQNPENYLFYWYNWDANNPQFASSAFLGDKSEIMLKESGRYYVEIVDENGNKVAESDPVGFEVIFNKKPFTIIGRENIKFDKDTTLVGCLGESFMLSVSNGVEETQIDWYELVNDEFIDLGFSGFNYNTNKSAKYVAISNNNECSDTSSIITLDFRNTAIRQNKTELNFIQLSNNPDVQQFTLRNLGTSTQVFDENDIILPNSNFFSITSPQFPFSLDPDEAKTIEIEFNAPEGTIVSNDILIIFSDCYKEYEILINASRQPDNLIIDPPSIEYGSLLFCGSKTKDTIITITNTGSEEIELLQAITKQQFPVDDLPTTIAANSSKTLSTRFISFNLGDFEDSIVIPVRISNSETRIKIPVKGSIKNPEITIESRTFLFPPINDLCDQVLDTVILIENTGDFEVEIDDYSNRDIEFLNTPFKISPGSSRYLEIVVNELGVGQYSRRVNFDFQPCFINAEFFVDWEVLPFSISNEPDQIDFGLEYLCDDEVSKTLSQTIDLENDLGRTFTINNLALPQFINTSLEVGNSFFDGLEFEIYLIANAEQNLNGLIDIELEECDQNYTIGTNYNVNKIDFNFPDSLIFDLIDLPNSDQQQLIIRNVDPEDDIFLTMSDLADSDIFEFVEPPTPNEFYPSGNSGYSFEVVFTPDKVGEFSETIYIDVLTPCLYQDSVILYGRALAEPISDLSIVLDLRGEENIDLGNNYNYQVFAEIQSSLEDKSAINWISFDLLFNQNNVDVRSFQSTSGNIYIENDQLDILSGRYSSTLNLSGVNVLTNSELISFELEPLLGKDLNTILKLNNVEMGTNSNLISIETDSLSALISGECKLEERLIETTGAVMIRNNEGEINHSDLKLDFSVVTTDKTNIVVFNSEGKEIINAIDGSLQPGKYSVTIPSKYFSNGLYFVQMNSGIAHRQIKFIQTD